MAALSVASFLAGTIFFKFFFRSASSKSTAYTTKSGVVFSVFDLDDPVAGRLLVRFSPGESLFLNSAVERLPGDVVRRPDGAS